MFSTVNTVNILPVSLIFDEGFAQPRQVRSCSLTCQIALKRTTLRLITALVRRCGKNWRGSTVLIAVLFLSTAREVKYCINSHISAPSFIPRAEYFTLKSYQKLIIGIWSFQERCGLSSAHRSFSPSYANSVQQCHHDETASSLSDAFGSPLQSQNVRLWVLSLKHR